MIDTTIAIMFADLAGFTALAETHGDTNAAQAAAKLYELTALALAGSARLVKRIGDAVMVVASEPADILESAFQLTALIRSEPAFPSIRVGAHVGHAVEQDGDFFGNVVNLAARVAAAAGADQILCTGELAHLLDGRSAAIFRPLGAFQLKNITEPVPLFGVTRGDDAQVSVTIDPVCRMQVDLGRSIARVLDDTAYHFCSEACAKAFDSSPQKFVKT